MKKTLLSFLLFAIVSIVNAQISSYLFTNGSLAGLTQFGSSLTVVQDRIGVATDAVDLNGDYLRTATSSPTNLSMSFWVRTSTVDANKRIIIEQSNRNSGFDNSNQSGWYAYLKDGKVGFAANYWHTHDDTNGNPVVSYTGYEYTGSTTNIADGYWHNVIVTAQREIVYVNSWLKRYTYKIYINGVLENTKVIDRGSGSSASNINASLVPSALAMTIANNNSSNLASTERYQEEIDDIRYYNTIVNSSQISTLANEKRCSTPTNIVASNITTTTATITWDNNPDALTWDLIYVISGQPMINGTLISGIAANTQPLTGLTMNTSYDIYVKSNCTGFSGWWSLPNAFTTYCPSTFANAIAQDISIQLDAAGLASIEAADIDNGSTVDCGNMVLSIDKTDFDCSDVGVNVVTLTVTDNQSNVSTATANVTVLGIINDETLTANQTTICGGQSVTVTTGSSMNGIVYTLRNDATNAVVGSPMNGTGSALVFNTGALNSTETFNVLAEPVTNNRGLDFDGTNDLVPTNVTFFAPSSTLTLETWVYPRSSNYDRLISNLTTGNNAGNILLDTYDSNNNGRGVRFFVVGAGNVTHSTTTPNALTLNTWNHVAATFDNGTVKIYVNGILKTTTTAPFTSIPAIASTFHFGEDQVIGTAEYLNGKLDDIRIWNTSRTITEIAGNMNNCLQGNESGLYAYFKLSEGTGNTITDLKNGFTGTLTNMDAATDWVAGQITCAVICSVEMSQTVTINVNPSYNLTATAAVCSGGTYTFPDGTTQNNITSQAVHTSNLQTYGIGCDSIIVTTVNVNPVYNLAVTVGVCSGDNYTFPDGTTQNNITAQVVQTSNLQTYSKGCDSIIVTTLNVNPIYNQTGTATICSGDNYTFPDGTTQNNITAQVIHTSNLQTVGKGCDSIIVTTVNVNPTYNQTGTATICSGDNYTFPDGSTQNNITAQVVQTSTFQTYGNGCDSIIVTTVNVNPSYNQTETVAVCIGASYTFPDGTTQNNLTAQVVHTSNLQTVGKGCDSIIVTTVNITNIDNTTNVTGGTINANQAGAATYRWLNCNNSYAVISGETAQSYTPSTNGNYAVEITLNGCKDTSACVNMTSVGIEENGSLLFTLSPNPTNNFVTIQFNQTLNSATIEVMNAIGQVISKQQSNNTITIIELPEEKGFYFIRVTAEGMNKTMKVIKQ